MHEYNIDFNKLYDGNQDEWDFFAKKYTPIIYCSVIKILKAECITSDITQDIFLKLIKNDYQLLKTFDHKKASISTWLSVIARSTTIDYLRKQKKTEELQDYHYIEDNSEIKYNIPEKHNIPYNLLTIKEKLLLHLVFDKEYSTAEIAKIMDIEIKTVRSKKSKALSKLRKNMKNKN